MLTSRFSSVILILILINYILSSIDYLIDGRYEYDKKDLKLKMRGSSNQNVYQQINNKLKKIDI